MKHIATAKGLVGCDDVKWTAYTENGISHYSNGIWGNFK